MPSTLVIFNPVAGRGRARHLWPQIEQALHGSGVELDAVMTRAPKDAVRLAREAAARYARVIAVGGDGTLNEVVNGLLQASGEQETLPIGLIPLGNGDDFAKMIPPETPLGGKPFDWREAVDKIARGQTKCFDAGRMLGDGLHPDPASSAFYFINGMDVGFGAHAALNFLTAPRFLKGMPAYLFAVLKTLVAFPVLPLRIQLDDQPAFEQPSVMTAVTNGRCFGNGFWVCPQARADDGIFDLMVGHTASRFKILRLVPRFMRGTHMNDPVLRMYRARRVVLESPSPLVVEADGEIPFHAAHHVEIELLPGKVRMIV